MRPHVSSFWSVSFLDFPGTSLRQFCRASIFPTIEDTFGEFIWLALGNSRGAYFMDHHFFPPFLLVEGIALGRAKRNFSSDSYFSV
jgi:hypothetical protein